MIYLFCNVTYTYFLKVHQQYQQAGKMYSAKLNRNTTQEEELFASENNKNN